MPSVSTNGSLDASCILARLGKAGRWTIVNLLLARRCPAHIEGHCLHFPVQPTLLELKVYRCSVWNHRYLSVSGSATILWVQDRTRQHHTINASEAQNGMNHPCRINSPVPSPTLSTAYSIVISHGGIWHASVGWGCGALFVLMSFQKFET